MIRIAPLGEYPRSFITSNDGIKDIFKRIERLVWDGVHIMGIKGIKSEIKIPL